MFLHLPVNHPLRPLYRFLGGLAGLHVLVFGIVGLVASWGHGIFGRGQIEALGLRTNVAFSVLSILMGLAVVIAAIIDNNRDHYMFLFGGMAFFLIGMFMLAFLQTGLNLFNFTVTTCAVSFVLGLVLFTAGLYTRHGTAYRQRAEELHRHAGRSGRVGAATG